MTRKEAKVAFIEELKYILNTKLASKEVNFKFIDRIFNDHEEQLKANDEEINRLKKAMKEFVDSCENGEFEIKYTYSKFKELLKEIRFGWEDEN